jgi:hypothetical protein
MRGPAGLQAQPGAVERWQANDMMLRHLVLIEAGDE